MSKDSLDLTPAISEEAEEEDFLIEEAMPRQFARATEFLGLCRLHTSHSSMYLATADLGR